MKNKEILEKAIQKAIEGGWNQPLVYIHVNVKDRWLEFRRKVYIEDTHLSFGGDQYASIEEIIFNHQFAKALWGEELHHETFVVPKELNKRFAGTRNLDIKPMWQYHLREMVIADDPIKYLGENI